MRTTTDGGGEWVSHRPDVRKRNFFCVSESVSESDTPPPLVHVRPDRKIFCVPDVYVRFDPDVLRGREGGGGGRGLMIIAIFLKIT